MTATDVPDAVDFDLHGAVRVRLLDARAADVAVISRQLGPLAEEPRGEPDVTIRFADRVPISGTLRLIGLDEAAFDDDGFLVVRAKHKARTRVRIPLDQVGTHCEILCERGTPAVPLLVAIVNLTALARGVLPLHAAAFAHRERGVVVTGWAKGGKTETLLAFADRGARYLADEWCYIDPSAGRVRGVPEPVRVWRWQLAGLPDLRSRVPRADRTRMAVLAGAAAATDALPQRIRSSKAGRLAGRAGHHLRHRIHTLVPPGRLFGDAGMAEGEADVPLGCLVLAVSAESERTTVTSTEPGEVAKRVLHSLQFERLPFMAAYRMFRYAFPDASNPHVDAAEERERRLLDEVFQSVPALVLEHPYPVHVPDLYDHLAPHLEGASWG